MPNPPRARSSEWLTCVNGVNIWPSMSGGMPMPVSATLTTTCRSSVATESEILPPGSVYLLALLRQIRSDLRQSHGISLHPYRLFRQ